MCAHFTENAPPALPDADTAKSSAHIMSNIFSLCASPRPEQPPAPSNQPPVRQHTKKPRVLLSNRGLGVKNIIYSIKNKPRVNDPYAASYPIAS